MRLIDADALVDDLKESAKATREWREGTQDEEIKIRAEQAHGTFIECALRVKNAPTIEAEPVRHGRWIPVTNGRGGHECNQCHNYAPSYQTGKEHLSDYCPHCGARMDADHIADDSKKVGGE